MPTSQETIVLGVEHDHELRETLVTVLRELGATGFAESWGIAGSQELQSVEAQLEGKTLLIETETYIGLSLTGDSILIRRIAALAKQRLPRQSP